MGKNIPGNGNDFIAPIVDFFAYQTLDAGYVGHVASLPRLSHRALRAAV